MEINYDNLLIREIKENDLFAIHDFVSQGDVCMYQAWGPNSEEDTKKYITSSMSDCLMSPRINFNFFIIDKIENKTLGTCGVYLKNTNTSEIGFILEKKNWRKGIGYKVVKYVIDFCFNELKVQLIIATCDVLNEGSKALLEKVGFQKTKTIENHMNIRGRMRTLLIMS